MGAGRRLAYQGVGETHLRVNQIRGEESSFLESFAVELGTFPGNQNHFLGDRYALKSLAIVQLSFLNFKIYVESQLRQLLLAAMYSAFFCAISAAA